jgi:hypothetical protein
LEVPVVLVVVITVVEQHAEQKEVAEEGIKVQENLRGDNGKDAEL